MKKLLYTTLIACSIVLTACPYEGASELNIYTESLKVDKNFFGDWSAFHEEGKETLVIDKANKTVMNIHHKAFEGKDFKEKNYYRGYTTDINGTIFFTLEKDSKHHMYAKFGWAGDDEFYIQLVEKEYMEKNYTPEKQHTDNLRAFFEEHGNEDAMFDDKLTFYRKNTDKWTTEKAKWKNNL